ncbi:MAG TPA: isoamylase early set domain-containing protein [Phycisphaerae bacterium]|nr:isoamylase early set domain-containing protein [Phycisphaerae bacterium]
MYEKGKKQGTVRFTMAAGDGMKAVSVAGDFSEWQPVPMRKRQGAFSTTVSVPPGTHHYKFIVDGQWRPDPENPQAAPNPYDTLNSVLELG